MFMQICLTCVQCSDHNTHQSVVNPYFSPHGWELVCRLESGLKGATDSLKSRVEPDDQHGTRLPLTDATFPTNRSTSSVQPPFTRVCAPLSAALLAGVKSWGINYTTSGFFSKIKSGCDNVPNVMPFSENKV